MQGLYSAKGQKAIHGARYSAGGVLDKVQFLGKGRDICYNRAADNIRMSPDKFCCGMDDQIGSIVKWILKIRQRFAIPVSRCRRGQSE